MTKRELVDARPLIPCVAGRTKGASDLLAHRWLVFPLSLPFGRLPRRLDLQMLLDAARRWRSCKVTERDLAVESTRHRRARLIKYYPRPPCAPAFVKSRMLRPLQTHFSLFKLVIVFTRAAPAFFYFCSLKQ